MERGRERDEKDRQESANLQKSVQTALVDADYRTARVEEIGLSEDCPAEEHPADRELSSGGRSARHVLGDTAWRGFLERAGAESRPKFGDRISYERRHVELEAASGLEPEIEVLQGERTMQTNRHQTL